MCMQQSDPDTLVTLYSQSIIDVMDKHCPSRTITLKGNSLKPWYSDEVHEARRIRHRLQRQYSMAQFEIHRQLLKDKSISVARSIDRKKGPYLQTEVC